jgi:archaellum component FlaC
MNRSTMLWCLIAMVVAAGCAAPARMPTVDLGPRLDEVAKTQAEQNKAMEARVRKVEAHAGKVGPLDAELSNLKLRVDGVASRIDHGLKKQTAAIQQEVRTTVSRLKQREQRVVQVQASVDRLSRDFATFKQSTTRELSTLKQSITRQVAALKASVDSSTRARTLRVDRELAALKKTAADGDRKLRAMDNMTAVLKKSTDARFVSEKQASAKRVAARKAELDAYRKSVDPQLATLRKADETQAAQVKTVNAKAAQLQRTTDGRFKSEKAAADKQLTAQQDALTKLKTQVDAQVKKLETTTQALDTAIKNLQKAVADVKAAGAK